MMQVLLYKLARLHNKVNNTTVFIADLGCYMFLKIQVVLEFGEQHPFRQQDGFPTAKVLSNNDAGPSKQKTPLFSQQTAHQGQYQTPAFF
jgi:hypothetical protein